LALWWWIDRWRKSTAYTDMTLEQQGAYRNLLDEAWLRAGALPRDPRILAKASGDPTRWPRLKNVLMKRFFLGQDGCLHNETLDQILKESRRRADNQRNYRERLKASNGRNNGANNKADSPSPSPSVRTYPPNPPTGGRRRKRQNGIAGSTCQHTPRCRSYAACLERITGKKR